MKRWIVFVEDDIEPEIKGPYSKEGDRDTAAKALKKEFGDQHGIFALDIKKDGTPSISAYSGGFFEGCCDEED